MMPPGMPWDGSHAAGAGFPHQGQAAEEDEESGAAVGLKDAFERLRDDGSFLQIMNLAPGIMGNILNSAGSGGHEPFPQMEQLQYHIPAMPQLPPPQQQLMHHLPPPQPWNMPQLPPPQPWNMPQLPPPQPWNMPQLPPPQPWNMPQLPPSQLWNMPQLPPPQPWNMPANVPSNQGPVISRTQGNGQNQPATGPATDSNTTNDLNKEEEDDDTNGGNSLPSNEDQDASQGQQAMETVTAPSASAEEIDIDLEVDDDAVSPQSQENSQNQPGTGPVTPCTATTDLNVEEEDDDTPEVNSLPADGDQGANHTQPAIGTATAPSVSAEEIDLNMEVDDDIRPDGGFALRMWLCDQEGGVCAYQCENLSAIIPVDCGSGPLGRLFCCDQ